MPIYITNNGPKWVSDKSSSNGLSFGNRNTQDSNLEDRQEKTIISTARVLRYARDGKLSEEDVEIGIERNANAIKMEPSELRQLAEEYLRYEDAIKESESKGIERE